MLLKSLSLIFIMLSVFWGISSVSLISMWVALELNMIMFLGYLSLSGEALIKYAIIYLIIQAMGSGGVLGSVVLLYFFPFWPLGATLSSVFLLLKLGIAPFHSWLLILLTEMTWDSFFLLVTIQKIIPMMMLFYIKQISVYILCLNMILVTWGMLSSSCSSYLLACLAIASSSWPLLTSDMSVALLYLIFYGVGLSFVVSLLGKLQVMHTSSLKSHFFSMFLVVIFLVSSMSLGGVPPTSGFWLKILILITAEEFYSWGSLFMVLILSVFILFVYLRFSFIWLSLNSSGPLGISVLGFLKEILFFFLLALSPIILFILFVGVKA